MTDILERDWITQAGLRAVVLYVHDSHRCGYVGVPPGQPLHGAEYDEPCSALRPVSDDEPLGKRTPLTLFLVTLGKPGDRTAPQSVFDVHGGLTYSADQPDYPVPSENWWFGFDCAHAGDRTKYLPHGVHRSLDYVIAECESLAAQIKERTL